MRADVVETVVMHADVREMRRHHRNGSLAPKLKKMLVARRIELQEGRAVLKTLCPLGPPFARVTPVHGENRRRQSRRATRIHGVDALSRALPKPREPRQKIDGRKLWIELDHRVVG